jgi:hypothetical protein
MSRSNPDDIWPSYDGSGIVNFPVTVLAHFSSILHDPSLIQRGLAPPLLSSHHVPLRPDMRVLLCFLIDAFGYSQLREQLTVGNMPNLQQLLDRGAQLTTLTSVFPSTTTSALFSLNTGLAPAQHGVVGHTIWLPQLGLVANMIRMGPAAGGPAFEDLTSFAVSKTVYERLLRSGAGAYHVGPADLVRTPLTVLLHRGATYVPFATPSTIGVRLDGLVADLLDAGRPGYIFVYWPFIDTVAHASGTASLDYTAEANLVDHLFFGWLRRRSFGGRVAAFVLADHGQSSLDRANAVLLNAREKITTLLARPPAGERRALCLKAQEGKAEALRAALLAEFEGDIQILAVTEAIQQGLFGPVPTSGQALPSPLELAERVGDWIVLPKGALQLNYAHRQEAETMLAGGHGGLAEAEMQVPLVSLSV